MLTIRPEQMNAFTSVKRTALEERIAGQLRSRFPIRCDGLGEEGLRAQVRRKIEIAEANGVTTTESIAFLCHWMFELGDEFESSPAGDEAFAILQDPEFPGQIKVLLIGECLNAASGGRLLVTAEGA